MGPNVGSESNELTQRCQTEAQTLWKSADPLACWGCPTAAALAEAEGEIGTDTGTDIGGDIGADIGMYCRRTPIA